MSDVMKKCIENNSQISGRVVTKMPGCAIQGVTPKINQQMSEAVAIRKYDDRFDDSSSVRR